MGDLDLRPGLGGVPQQGAFTPLPPDTSLKALKFLGVASDALSKNGGGSAGPGPIQENHSNISTRTSGSSPLFTGEGAKFIEAIKALVARIVQGVKDIGSSLKASAPSQKKELSNIELKMAVQRGVFVSQEKGLPDINEIKNQFLQADLSGKTAFDKMNSGGKQIFQAQLEKVLDRMPLEDMKEIFKSKKMTTTNTDDGTTNTVVQSRFMSLKDDIKERFISSILKKLGNQAAPFVSEQVRGYLQGVKLSSDVFRQNNEVSSLLTGFYNMKLQSSFESSQALSFIKEQAQKMPEKPKPLKKPLEGSENYESEMEKYNGELQKYKEASERYNTALENPCKKSWPMIMDFVSQTSVDTDLQVVVQGLKQSYTEFYTRQDIKEQGADIKNGLCEGEMISKMAMNPLFLRCLCPIITKACTLPLGQKVTPNEAKSQAVVRDISVVFQSLCNLGSKLAIPFSEQFTNDNKAEYLKLIDQFAP